jgi:hypothetical protein
VQLEHRREERGATDAKIILVVLDGEPSET